jgi:UDP-N-acetylenolpyruvoylglucosamine reductase
MSAAMETIEPRMSAEENVAAGLAACVSPATLVRCDEPLAKRTTLRVGGPADYFIEPAGDEDLAAVVKFCDERQIPIFVLGRGSNLLVRDGGVRGVVVSLAHPHFSRVEISGERLNCGAGAKLKTVAVEARRHSLAGLEFLEGIPGSVGGALRMNAGAMGSATFRIVESVRLMGSGGGIYQLSGQEMKAEYRSCALLKDHIALSAVFKGVPAAREDIEARMSQFNSKRWETQPAAPSAGCIFKNPPLIPAGKLVDELGLKGTRVGGAVVSAEHGNFIINDGHATARDVLELIGIIKQRVKTERGIDLHTEVEIIGAD